MRRVLLCLVLLALGNLAALGLSEQLHQPAIFFPKKYDTRRAGELLTVLRRPELKYATGLTSYWEPEWSTTLVYSGGAAALRSALEGFQKIDGLRVEVTLSRDLSKETGSALIAGSWWIKYRHTAPDTVEVRINLDAPELDLEQLRIPGAR